MSGFIGSGKLYFNRVVGGVSQGWLPFGNATKFEIKENSEIKERKSKQKGTYGQVLDSAAIKQPAEISISMDDLNKDNLALAFLGDVAAINVTGASATDEGHSTGKYGSMIQLAQGNISNVVIKDAATGLITYTVNVDYRIESAALGLIEILKGDGTNDIAEDQTYVASTSGLLVSYDYGNKTANKVQGGTNASIKVALLLDGENFANQSLVNVNVFEAVLAPQSGVDFLADDYASMELNGTLNTPSGKTFAYEIITDIVNG